MYKCDRRRIQSRHAILNAVIRYVWWVTVHTTAILNIDSAVFERIRLPEFDRARKMSDERGRKVIFDILPTEINVIGDPLLAALPFEEVYLQRTREIAYAYKLQYAFLSHVINNLHSWNEFVTELVAGNLPAVLENPSLATQVAAAVRSCRVLENEYIVAARTLPEVGAPSCCM